MASIQRKKLQEDQPAEAFLYMQAKPKENLNKVLFHPANIVQALSLVFGW